MTGTELRLLRESLGMTQEDVADYLGLRHKSQVAHLESGRSAISGAKLRLLEALRESGGKNISGKIPYRG